MRIFLIIIIIGFMLIAKFGNIAKSPLPTHQPKKVRINKVHAIKVMKKNNVEIVESTVEKNEDIAGIESDDRISYENFDSEAIDPDSNIEEFNQSASKDLVVYNYCEKEHSKAVDENLEFNYDDCVSAQSVLYDAMNESARARIMGMKNGFDFSGKKDLNNIDEKEE